PMADLVRRGAAEVERGRCGALRSKTGMEDHDAVRRRGTAGELRVSEQAAAERTDPNIEVAVGRPCVVPAAGAVLDGVLVTERRARPPECSCIRCGRSCRSWRRVAHGSR